METDKISPNSSAGGHPPETGRILSRHLQAGGAIERSSIF